MNYAQIALDENGLLLLTFDPPDGNGSIQAHITSKYQAINSPLVKNILPLISIEGGGHTIKPYSPDFTLSASDIGNHLQLRINNQPFADFSVEGDHITAHSTRKLSVFETRIIGRAPQTTYPAPLNVEGMLTPITDLHTHLSAQVSAHDLIKIGQQHDIYYPTAALRDLGIAYSKKGLKHITKRIFLPLAHLQTSQGDTEPAVPLSSLSKEGLITLEKAMSLSPEDQCTFEAMEKCYYLREPFTKNKDLLEEILWAVARNYQKDGIKYAELCSNAILDPQWLKIIHDVAPDIEKETKVKLRFKAGLPRNLNAKDFAERIEQYKQIAASPYVIGPDILGYEINKTSSMQTQLEDLAKWMKAHQPDDILQIHAGENGKNSRNVLEALQLTDTQNIRLDVGHALYGMNDEAMGIAHTMSKEGKLIAQLNIDANLALNNIDFPHDVPLKRFIDNNIAFILSSDGAGIYRTNAKQTAMAAVICGMTSAQFQALNRFEENYLQRQQAIFDRKQRELPADFFTKLEAPKDKPPKPAVSKAALSNKEDISPQLQRLFRSQKRPVFLAGVGGERSWNAIVESDRAAFAGGLKAMLEGLEPQKVYFIRGRTKPNHGVNAELEKAIVAYNATHPHSFDCVTLLAQRDSLPAGPPQPHFYTHKISQSIMNLPGSFIDFLIKQKGIALYAGGKGFTRDFILLSAQAGIPFALIKEMGGASQQKAEVYTDHALESAKMAQWVQRKLLRPCEKYSVRDASAVPAR